MTFIRLPMDGQGNRVSINVSQVAEFKLENLPDGKARFAMYVNTRPGGGQVFDLYTAEKAAVLRFEEEFNIQLIEGKPVIDPELIICMIN